MRSALLFILSVGVFAAAYFAMAWVMPDPEVAPQHAAQVVPTVPRQADRVIGDVDGVTLRSHDARTGAPILEVRIAEYRRTGENQVLLKQIDATILAEASGGGVVTLSAPSGTVDVEAEAAEEDRLSPEMIGTADVARLRDVTIRWFESAADATRGADAATLTLRLDNLVFDNKRYSLFTDDTEIAGATVLADDVPVEVRGRDYDFDGYGLLIRWDAETRRPTLIRVARGERLTIKNERALLQTPVAHAKPARAFPPLAATDERAVREAIAPEPPEHARVYRATLSQNLRVEQGGITKLQADGAEMLFALEALAAARPESRSGSREAPPYPSTSPARDEPQAAENPFVPVTISWEGELRVEAQVAAAGMTLQSAQDVRVHVSGSPLVMRQEGMEARGLSLRFAKAADEAEFTGNDATPVTLVDGEGNTLVTSRLIARPNAATATSDGAGYAAMTAGDGESMQLRWQRRCDFAFASQDADDGKRATGRSHQLKQVAARGNVTVRHPELELDSDSLDIRLERGEENADSQLRAVAASGAVRWAILEEGEPEALRLTSDGLTLDLPQGIDGTVTAVAQGSVRSDGRGQQLEAQRVQATFAPDESGTLETAEVVATGEVRGRDESGRTFRADVLWAVPIPPVVPAGALGEESNRSIQVRLEGAQGRSAIVEMGAERLLSPVLEFNSAAQTVRAPGAGEMHAAQQVADGGELPVTVAWAGSMTGSAKEVTLDGGTHISGVQAVAAERIRRHFEVHSDRATLTMAPAPTTNASGERERVATGDAVTTQPAELAGRIERLALRGQLRATAEERNTDGLLRSVDLRAEMLDAWPNAQATRLNIESPGRILFRDLRPLPSTRSPVAAADTTQPRELAEATGGFRGNAAIEWRERLGFDPATGILLLSGGVSVAIEPAQTDAEIERAPRTQARVFRLDAQHLRVQTELVAKIGDNGGEEQEEQREVRRVAAEGQARFVTGRLSFEAGGIDFDPAAGTVTARGVNGQPVVVLDGEGVPSGRFSELIYNVHSGQIERLTELGAGG